MPSYVKKTDMPGRLCVFWHIRFEEAGMILHAGELVFHLGDFLLLGLLCGIPALC